MNIPTDTYKIDNFIKQNISIIYDFPFNGDLFLVGGAIPDLLSSGKPRDLDFVLLTNKDNIMEFIDNYHLNYERNFFKGYKIIYNNITIDIWPTNDLYKAIEYNLDAIFYHIKNQILIPFGYIDGLEQRKLITINSQNHGTKKMEQRRHKKLMKLINNQKWPKKKWKV